MAEDRDFDIKHSPGISKYKGAYDNSYAIVIGIDSYKHPRLSPLGNAEEDAQNINDVLTYTPYNFQVTLLRGNEATRLAITRALNQVIKSSQLDDRIIFYFAGHGYIHPDIRNIDVGYIACADTDPQNPYDGLEYEDITNLSRFAKAKHIAFIFDACFSGKALGLTRAGISDIAVSEYLLHPTYQVLTAGAVEAVADARSMTGELVKVLKGGVPERKGYLTFTHVSQHIHDIVHNKSKGRQSPQYGILEGSSKGQMVLTKLSLLEEFTDNVQLSMTNTDYQTKSQTQTWKVKVFNFRNHNPKMKQELIGERFSGFILNSLIKLKLQAEGTISDEVYFPTRGFEPESDFEFSEYSDLVPFVAVVGFVWNEDKENFGGAVRVASVTSDREIDTLMVEEVICSKQSNKMRIAANDIAERIRRVILKITSAPPTGIA